MYSRAHLLIQKEINELKNEKGLSIGKLDDNNVFELIASIEGLPHTSWENGVFQIYLKFSENYNFTPPKVYFQTVPYHPNVDISNGRPSLDFLDEISKWKPEYTIKHILKSLQQLLANPLLDRSVNMDAVFMLKGNPDQYDSIIKQSVIATKEIQQLLKQKISESSSSEFETAENISVDFSARYPLFKLNKEPTTLLKNENEFKKMQIINEKSLKNISFDDYCKLWKGIATTKSSNDEENAYLKTDLFQNPHLMPQHISISLIELEEQINKQLNEHKNIMYGKFNFENKFLGELKERTLPPTNTTAVSKSNIQPKVVNYNDLNNNKIEKSSYLTNKANSSFSKQNSSLNFSKSAHTNSTKTSEKLFERNDELFEQEVDELINWTKNIE